MAKLSIIVPVYNVEQYIERCARSLFEQTYKYIEYIFVDDSSCDKSYDTLLSVIAEYPEKSSQVKVIRNVHNGGSARARNIALEYSTGDYITFVDADDWIESDGVEKMMHCAQQKDADIVMSDFIIEDDNQLSLSKQGLIKSDALELIKAMMTGRLHGSNCNKIYRRSLVVDNNIRFIDGADYTEDLAFNIKFLTLAGRIAYLSIAYYHYCIYEISMSHAIKDPDMARRKDLQKVINVMDVDAWLHSHGWGNKLCKELDYYKLQAKMPFLRVVNRRSCLRWCALFPEANKSIMEHDRFPILYRYELQLLVHRWICVFICLHKLKLLIQKQ